MASRLEAAANEWQALQKDMAKLQTSKRKLVTQLHENEMVKKELDLLKDDANVFKLIGPALIKQEPESAKATVAKRIEYLTSEVNRIDKSTQDLDKQMLEKKKLIIELQTQAQQAQAARQASK